MIVMLRIRRQDMHIDSLVVRAEVLLRQARRTEPLPSCLLRCLQFSEFNAQPMFESLEDTYVFQQQSPKPVRGHINLEGPTICP